MKFYFFHLMPYAALDLDYDQKHDSAWVTLPNSYYDPKNGHQLYNRYLDEIEYADELGFDGVCVNEHHQNAYGLMPIPSIMAGALARRTKNVKIAVLGRALPLLNNPLVVAEEYAMLDNITGGRLIAGFVRGIGAEYHSFGANPAESHGRFHEAHDLIIQAWTRAGSVSVRGQVLPLRIRQHLAALLPAAASADLDPVAGIARDHRMGLASGPQIHLSADLQPGRGAGALHGDVSRMRRPIWLYGHAGAARLVDPACTSAETDEIAHREAKPHIEAFLNKFLRMPREMLLPPGYLSLQSMMGVMQAKAAIGGKQTIDDVIERGMFLCGSPATLREKIEKYQKEIGFGYLLPMMQFGTLPHDLTMKSTEIFGREIIPYFRGRPDAMPARTELAAQGA